jgi:hypothetical protein
MAGGTRRRRKKKKEEERRRRRRGCGAHARLQAGRAPQRATRADQAAGLRVGAIVAEIPARDCAAEGVAGGSAMVVVVVIVGLIAMMCLAPLPFFFSFVFLCCGPDWYVALFTCQFALQHYSYSTLCGFWINLFVVSSSTLLLFYLTWGTRTNYT